MHLFTNMTTEKSITKTFVRLLRLKRQLAEAKSFTGITPADLVRERQVLQLQFDAMVNSYILANIDEK